VTGQPTTSEVGCVHQPALRGYFG